MKKLTPPTPVPKKPRLPHSDKITHNKKSKSFKVSNTTHKHRTISKLLARPNYFYPTLAPSTTQPSKKNQTETRSDHSCSFRQIKLKNHIQNQRSPIVIQHLQMRKRRECVKI